MRSRPTRSVVLAVLCAAATAGCRFTLLGDPLLDGGLPAGATTSDAAPGPATASRPPPKTIPLELVFVRCGDHDAGWQDELWQLADEQALSAELRRRLAANGLRAGVLSGPPPPALAARFQAADTSPPTEDLPNGPSERPAVVRRFLKLLPGRDNEIVAATGLAELVLLEHDGEALHGGTYQDASAHFVLRAWPAADGRVRIEVTPTIKHGPLERSWVGEEGVFRVETGQRKHVLDRLEFEATLPEGATLFLGCVGDASSTVGDAFFRERARGQATTRLLAIRPQARAVDPLFAPDAVESAPAAP